MISSWQQKNTPLRRSIDIDHVGQSALYILSDMSYGVTGEVHMVDSGYHITSKPTLETLNEMDEK